MVFQSKQLWASKGEIFQHLQIKNKLIEPETLFDLISSAPHKFDELILNYQVEKTSPSIIKVKHRIKYDTFSDTEIGELIVNGIDWSIFHRQVFPAFCSAQLMNSSVENIHDFIYCYAFLVVGPTQLLDDKLDNPFKMELDLRDYQGKKEIELWAISDLMIRKGVELFLKYSPISFKNIAPLAFDMTYSMYKENSLKSYNEFNLSQPSAILNLYQGKFPPDMSSIFNETMFVGALSHLNANNLEDSISLARKFRLLRQQLNELEDFIPDLISGYIKKPAATVLNNDNYGIEFKNLIIDQIWNKENLKLIENNSYQLKQQDFFNWISKKHFVIDAIKLLIKSGVAEEIYHKIDELCFTIVSDIEKILKGKNYFDLLTIVLLKKALLERLNIFGYYPNKLINEKLLNLNFKKTTHPNKI